MILVVAIRVILTVIARNRVSLSAQKAIAVRWAYVSGMFRHQFVQPVVTCLAAKILNAWGLRVQLFARIIAPPTVNAEIIFSVRLCKAVAVCVGH